MLWTAILGWYVRSSVPDRTMARLVVASYWTHLKDAQPGEASAMAAYPEPASPEVTEAQAEPSDGTRRSKRARHRSGYYTDLLKGKK